MTPVLIGQILGVSFACGLNLYLTVAALGVLSRVGVLQGLPPGLQGLEGTIVIVSAALLYVVETVIDKVRHADSLWDAVHTFIRPPAAALLAVGALWGEPVDLVAPAAAIAFMVALAAHGTKAGVRLALNARMADGHTWVSIGEDVLAVAFATTAFLRPSIALFGTAAVLGILLLVGPRYWRAFRLGSRALGAWFRTLFSTSRWREEDEIPRRVRAHIEPPPLGGARPRGARGAVDGLASAGPYRNGWLVVTAAGPIFVYRTLLGHRKVDLPPASAIEVDLGVWADVVHVQAGDDLRYRLYMLKDGPPPEVVTENLHQGVS